MPRTLDIPTTDTVTSSEADLVTTDTLIRPFGSLSDLLLSPSVLSSETSLLTSELTSLCHASQPTFLLLHNTSSSLSASFNTLSSSLDSLLDTLPTLSTATQHFTQTTKPILEERRKAGLVLEQQEKLTDLLEIPALIDTCSRNGQYQDALELSIRAETLWQQFKNVDAGSGISGIIHSLEREVRGSVRLLLGGLVETLKGQAKLPILYKAMGFLRKMGGWEEEELAVLFLCCRGAFLEELHGANESGQGGKKDIAKYLRGYIDVFREGVYDVVTAYTTIFLDHAQYSHSQKPTAPIEELRFLLAVFTNNQIAHLISTLSSNLPQIDDFTSLSSLLTQLNYCGTSFARVGLEFRPLITSPFEDAVLSNVRHSIESATATFVGSISDSEKNGLSPSIWLVSGSTIANGLPGRSTSTLPNIPDSLEIDRSVTTQTHIPAPQILTFSPLLATFLNSHLTTLNSLRLLPILSLLPVIYNALCQSLATSIRVLLDYARISASPTSPTLRMSFERRNSEISLAMSPTRGSRVHSLSGAATPTTETSGSLPSGLQRSSSITSRPYSSSARQSVIMGEDAKAKQEMEQRVLLAVGKALVRILVPFLKKGLLQDVYGQVGLEEETLPTGEGANELLSVVEDWEKWYDEWNSKGVNGGGT
jgi:conserved oligomeric Golgi complex subunit 8